MDQRSVREIVQAPPPAEIGPILWQADRGSIHPKTPGVATLPDVLEPRGLDAGHFDDLLRVLAKYGLDQGAGCPFEEIRLTPAAAAEFGGPGPAR
jgi:hypothetical protein